MAFSTPRLLVWGEEPNGVTRAAPRWATSCGSGRMVEPRPALFGHPLADGFRPRRK
jgi:hypothetical protein